jgi:hypothetical protein
LLIVAPKVFCVCVSCLEASSVNRIVCDHHKTSTWALWWDCANT